MGEFAKMMVPQKHRQPVTLATALGLQKRPEMGETQKLLNQTASQVQIEPTCGNAVIGRSIAASRGNLGESRNISSPQESQKKAPSFHNVIQEYEKHQKSPMILPRDRMNFYQQN